MDMMEIRRGILLSQPHSVSVSGSLVTFSTDFFGAMQISGTGNVTACGKNLFQLWGNGYFASNTKIWSASSAGAVCRPIKVSAGTVVTLSQRNTSSSYQFHEWKRYAERPQDYSSDDNLLFTSGGGKTYTVYNDCFLTVFANIGTDGFDNRDVQLEAGTKPTEYEVFSGTTIPVGTSRKALAGINNVWSDSSDITVTYWTH